MCGRTRCTLAPEDVAAAAGIPVDQLNRGDRWVGRDRYAPSYNVSPGAWTPVVRAGGGRGGGGGGGGGAGGHAAVGAGDECAAEGAGGDGGGGRVVETMKWGLVPSFTKPDERPDHYRMFNARSETVESKGIFSRLLPRRRCVVLLNGFYEWKAAPGGKKQPYYVHLSPKASEDRSDNGDSSQGGAGSHGTGGSQGGGGGGAAEGPEPVLRMAGLYDTWTDANGQQVSTYTILTVDSSPRLSWLHDRMPALLVGDDDVAAWLEGGKMQVISPYNGPDLAWRPVTPAMSKPSYQAPDACRDTRTAKGAITAFFAPKGPAAAAAAAAASADAKAAGGATAGGGVTAVKAEAVPVSPPKPALASASRGSAAAGKGAAANSKGASSKASPAAKGSAQAAFARLFGKQQVQAAATKQEQGAPAAAAKLEPGVKQDAGVKQEAAEELAGAPAGPEALNSDAEAGPTAEQEAAGEAEAAAEAAGRGGAAAGSKRTTAAASSGPDAKRRHIA